MEKEMATHSSTLAWKIPWTEEPDKLQSMVLQRVWQDFTFTFHFHALEKEVATHSSVLAWKIPGNVELMGCSLWGRIESDTTEVTLQQQATVNTDAVNMGVHISLWDNYFISFEYIFRNEYISRSVKFSEKLPEGIPQNWHQYTFQPVIH